MRQQTTLNEVLRTAVAQWGDKIGLDFSGETFTYRQLDELSNRLANGLAALGVKRHDRVCSLLDNSPLQVFLLFAIARLGAVSVPLNTALRGEFLRHQIADAGACLIVSEAHYAERIVAVEDGIPATTSCVVRGEGGATGGSRLAFHPLEELLGADATPVSVETAPSELAVVLYTSGTTGPSKGCMISHNHLCNTGWLMATNADIHHDDIFWTPMPLFHMGAAGFLVGCIQLGARAAIAPQFSLSQFWVDIERSGASVALVISVMLVLVAEAPDNEHSLRCHGQLRAVVGVPFSHALIDKWKTRFGVRHAGAMGFGMTEATPMTISHVTQPAPDGASGRRFDEFCVEVVDERDRVLPPGEVGQLVVRPVHPDTIFMGYWQRPQATLEAWRNLWFHTGDLGRFDAEGFFHFVDRAKDSLRRGGENISSHEMEMTFRAHPAVADVAAHAVPSEKSEDEVMISVVRREGMALEAEELCLWSIERLPFFAVPRFIAFVPELPRNASGRVLKFELRQKGVTATTWDRAKSGIVVRKR